MGSHLTAAQTADLLTERLATNDGTPTITYQKVLAQFQAGLFHNVGQGRQVRFDSDALGVFISKTRYIHDPAEIASEIFRVSVLERQERREEILERGTGKPLSRFMGVDYTAPQLLDGIEGVWESSDANCDAMVASECTLLATCKGYVHPEHVRSVMDWLRIENGSEKYFRTGPASDAVKKIVGTGLWIDVPPGRQSDFLVKSEQ